MQNDLILDAIDILEFPFLAVGLEELVSALAHPRIKEGTHIILKIDGVIPERAAVVIKALARFLQKMNVPPDIAKEIGRSHVISSMPILSEIFGELTSNEQPDYRIQIGESQIIWEERSPWPGAYNNFFHQLTWILTVFAISIKEDSSNIPGISLLDLTSRTLPTMHHYAAASLGAWGGGTVNMQFLGLAALLDGLASPDINRQTMGLLGFDASTAESLDRSGLIAVHPKTVAAVFSAQGDNLAFGGLPVDEWNAANLPLSNAIGKGHAVVFGPASEHLDLDSWKAENANDIDSLSEHAAPEVGGLLVDKHYRTAFKVRRPGGQALYGMQTLLRDHYSEFYKDAPRSGLLRCKHYCIPIIDISTQAELNAWIEKIPIRSDDGVFFRGQSKLYKLPRADCVKAMLFGNSTADEPSLGTSAARRGFNYDALHFALRYYVQNRLLFREQSLSEQIRVAQLWRDKSQSPVCEIDYAVMALAQHYGLPSHGLDVTSSTDIAIWFATNRWSVKGGIAEYSKMQVGDWGDDPEGWPVVFACQQVTHSIGTSLQKCQELNEFGLIAKRPERQKASFFHGGHSDHQNRLAEAVVCAFRLGPGLWQTEANFETLFPGPDQDPAYKLMLEFADVPIFSSFGAGEVAKFA